MNFTRLALATLAAASLLPAFSAEPESVWISSLDLAPIVQGWGTPQADRSVTGTPMAIAGKKFLHGLGTHAESRFWINLHGTATRFSAVAGVDDNAKEARAALRFKVFGDGRLLWRSGVLRLGQAGENVDVDVSGVQTLLLAVNSAGDGTDFGHADWADARLLTSGPGPTTAAAPAEPPVVLTPPPPRTPRINGPRIFGVRPGHPFLFTIPASGDRPIRFSATHLPRGLVLDPASGQITGRIDQAGEYRVTLRAHNALGSGTETFRIRCGETLALTPHMGWNSWYVWESHVTDAIVRAAADAMVASGMINHGYQYVNIDDCWAVKPGETNPDLGGEPRDPGGRVNPNRRFPDMKALADYIHFKGLKAGIYTSPGPLTCGGHVGAYEHEELDARRFADWGFDFLKYDWCSYGEKAKGNTVADFQKPYRLMGGILRRQNRDIVLNLCQYGMGNVWTWGKAVGGQSWRTAGDLGGSFQGISVALFRDGFDVYARNELHNFGGPGAWNDPDYLLLGYLSNWKGQTVPTPLTPNEQYTHVSLWCLLAAPLIFSGDITRLDDFTLGLLCNDEVIQVDQDPLGKPGRRAALADDSEVWVRDLENGSKAAGLFNRGEMPATVTATWSSLGLTGPQTIRDLWRQQDIGSAADEFKTMVPAHGVVFVGLRAK